ncbi:hypothetical protein BV25DRAFT_1839306 [Artomyces pyxidatus]|uniref:Uncharacterized protein n=1 Tax=Artomyces pyxidatus TaxID=48021 RepID=A0ACB8SYP5_9AGAM|nr:hypothetical protein BV25DRAFT_1839306 [Artomyces pyxidatus]
MDDIWGNAWGEPSTSQHGSGTLPWASKPETLHQETSAAAGDEEADLAMPSWSTGSGMQWDEPPNLQGSLWSQTSPSSAAPWSLANPYSDIHITKAATSPPASDAEGSSHLANSLTASSPVIEVKEEEEVSPAASEPDVASEPPFESLSAPDQSPTSSPDAFGTFEVGAPQVHVDDADPWSSSAAVFDDELADAPDEWGSAWTGGQKRESEQDGGKMDEWESARRRKEEMDRRVPPELLASIMAQIDELTKDAWPDPEGATEEAEWQKRWHTGLDDVEGLDTLLHRYVPEMTLPQLPPFGKSFTGKAMASAVKLSRNSAIARASPMANFLAAKGSTAWETAVKSRVEVTTDEVPVGWRILEKEKEEKTDEKSKKSSTGLLASLWNRRASAAPREGITVTSPVQDSFPKEEKVTATGRSSMESVQSTNSAVTKPASPVTSSPSSASPVPTLTSTQTTPTTSYSESGLPSSEAITRGATPPPTAAPSAVSRFLNRFSRPRVPSASSPRNSLALSTDDLDFLTEFVPSVTDGDNEEMKDPQLRGLESMIASKPFTGRLPPPLPPPPPPPAPVPTMSTALPKTQPIDALSRVKHIVGVEGNRVGSPGHFVEAYHSDHDSTFAAEPES